MAQLKALLAAQEAALAALQQRLGAAATQPAETAPQKVAGSGVQVAASPPPQIAPIFDQPGVLTPRGRWLLEPSLQYAYSSSNRIALVGYTVVPAILVGVIDVREVKRSTWTGALALRVGLSNRAEIEAKLPYVVRSDTAIGREVAQGTSSNSSAPFNTSGSGPGDVELTARYQLNEGGAGEPYYVGSLRVKSRTGTDPFEVPVSTGVQGFRGEGVQTRLPTGSGFWGLQPAMTALFPSDPAVFFGTLSYLHSVKRRDVVQRTDDGPVPLGAVQPGGVFGFNLGMGLALNEKSSFSIGYDHSAIARTKLGGRPAADSVPLQLGTLLLGYAYRLDAQRSVNVSLGAGLTRDTPDLSLSLRLPVSF